MGDNIPVAIAALVSAILCACSPAPALPNPDVFPPQCETIGQQWVSPVDAVTLQCVPAGEFTMGAEADDTLASDDSKPKHPVYLDAFWIDRTEATNVNFQKCVDAGKCKPRPARRGTTGVASIKHLNYYYDPEFVNYPVLIYDPEDAAAYCAWSGRRLPTEAEFEKAARGTTDGIYPWGNELSCDRASYLGCADDLTPVDMPQAGASPYGVLNLSGNVWEWVADWYAGDSYAHAPRKNPTGPATGEYRVRRGGGWRSLSRHLRVTARASGEAQHYFDGQIGFRCALSAAVPATK